MKEELQPAEPIEIAQRRTAGIARTLVAAAFVALSAFAIGYRSIALMGLEQSAAMFVGLPTLLGVITVLVARPKTAIGIALEVVTLCLLASAVVFQEGFICIIFFAPLAYGCAILTAVLFDYARAKTGGPRSFVLTILPLLLLSTEGALISLPREASVTATRVIEAPLPAVHAALAQPPTLDLPLPGALEIGFPLPTHASGTGLEIGDRRVIHFAGGEGEPGDLVLRVAEVSPERIVFKRVSDSTHLNHWLAWHTSEVRLRATDHGTEVRWTSHFTRKLDPAWYFDPLMRLTVQSASGWLIEATAGQAEVQVANSE
jgi:hypothetical protein